MKRLLMIPGPAAYSERVKKAMSLDVIGHRTKEFEEVMGEINANMAKVFRTSGDVFITTSSSTGAIEMAVSNFISPNDSIVAASNGVFGERLVEICNTYSPNVHNIKESYGKPLRPDAFSIVNKGTKAVCVVHNETSMGVENPLAKISKIVKERNPDCLLIVDCVSSLGGVEFDMEKWNIDIAASGSQKAIAAPPGIGMMASREGLVAKAKPRNYYFDVKKYDEYRKKSQTPFTPAVPLFFGMREALREVMEEGLDKRIQRHIRCAKYMRDGARKLGLELFVADECASKTVTSISHDKPTWLKEEMYKNGVVIEGAKGETNIVRVGHLGNVTEREIDVVLDTMGKIVK
ncbi:MAG: alanine--glyoxylate aminotransferase family protein [Candidatus Aenigmarchaeota archaeon]|nr:alanine--glyoxylate aminotransferase family protein [Candidatus Aenigmarchaeota archaeon]